MQKTIDDAYEEVEKKVLQFSDLMQRPESAGPPPHGR
jgi:hypothetical protein